MKAALVKQREFVHPPLDKLHDKGATEHGGGRVQGGHHLRQAQGAMSAPAEDRGTTCGRQGAISAPAEDRGPAAEDRGLRLHH